MLDRVDLVDWSLIDGLYLEVTMSRNANQQRMNLLKKLYNEEMELINPDARYISDLHLSITGLEKEMNRPEYMMVEK